MQSQFILMHENLADKIYNERLQQTLLLLFYKLTVADLMDPIISNQMCIQVTAKYKT